MAKQKHFVTEHLEGISIKALTECSKELKEMLKGKHGLYALYKNNKLYYVGLGRLLARLNQHRRDRLKGKWNQFNVYVTKNDKYMKELETLALRIIDPKGNKVSGKFGKSKNRMKLFDELLQIKAHEKRAELLGGRRSTRNRRRAASKTKGPKKLSVLAGKRMQLWGECKGKEYVAQLRKDGTIKYNGKVYNSPSGAATAALGRNSNGWHFWRFKNKDGEWERLKYMK